jgi:hypothetical protein
MMEKYLIEASGNIDSCNVVEKDIPQKTVLRIRRVLPSYDHVKDF